MKRMGNSFEEVGGKLFTDPVGSASKCVQAIETVSALNMEPLIEEQIDHLLVEHFQRASRYAIKAMVWFALSEAIEFLCIGLAFWYGG